MAELTDAATLAVLREMDWPDDRTASAHVEPDGHQVTPPGAYWDMAQDVAGAVISAMKAIIRADERAKFAEEIETAFRHWEAGATTRPRVERGGFLNDRDWCLAIIRGHAARMPGTAQEATEPPDAYPSEGGAIPSPQKPAQEGER